MGASGFQRRKIEVLLDEVDDDDHPTGEDDDAHAQGEGLGALEAFLKRAAGPQGQEHAKAMQGQGDGHQHHAPQDLLDSGDVERFVEGGIHGAGERRRVTRGRSGDCP